MRVYRIIQIIILICALVLFGFSVQLCWNELQPHYGQTTGLEAIPFVAYYFFAIPSSVVLLALALIFGLHQKKSKISLMVFTIILIGISLLAPLFTGS